MKPKEYVRIKKAPYRSIWYADKIGRIFPSLGTWENAYKVDSPDRALYIRKEDAEVIVTEKRPAEAGERVLITYAAPIEEQAYEKGDVFVAESTNDPVHKCVRVLGMPEYIDYTEYEVIVDEVKNEEADGMEIDLNAMGYDELIAHGEEVMRMIRIRAYGEGYKQGKFDADMDATYMRPQEKSAQARRDEIVEQAKADVRNLVIHGLSHYNIDCSKGNETYRVMNYNVEFITDSRERKVTALVTRRHDKKPSHVGRAKAAPDDCFNVHIGKAIALRRALGLAVPDEYLNAPQPTEVRVGDVVQYSKRCATVVAGRPNGFGETKLTTANGLATRIIDDSREEVGE
ncbi:hypothetical protein [Bacillus sp. FSL K6-0036]|uniref:hypothetical protein n=1 Tax=Bacillus sp. FSL K6-0036 TaxID=2921405 RepID=UPI0030F81E5C